MKLLKVLKLNDKINWAIIVPAIVAIIVAAIFIYVDYQKQKHEASNNPLITEEYKPQPVSAKDNPRRSETISSFSQYGCASPATIEPEITKNPDSAWRIPKNGSSNTISLGKYKITNPQYIVLDIPTLWLYFFSDKLSNRDDKIYALESSYVARMKIIVNGYEKEIKLGGPEYMLIELPDYPFGDIYPYDKKTILEFEVLIELKCNNFQNGVCLGNNKKPLDFINGADVQAQFRIFAIGCQEFTKDIVVDSKIVLE